MPRLLRVWASRAVGTLTSSFSLFASSAAPMASKCALLAVVSACMPRCVCVCVIRATAEHATNSDLAQGRRTCQHRPCSPPPPSTSRWTSGRGEQHTCCRLPPTLLHGDARTCRPLAEKLLLLPVRTWPALATHGPRHSCIFNTHLALKTNTYTHETRKTKTYTRETRKTCTHGTHTLGSARGKSTCGRDHGQAGLGSAHHPHALRTCFLPGTHQEIQ